MATKIKQVSGSGQQVWVGIENTETLFVPIDERIILEWLNNCTDAEALKNICIKAVNQRRWVEEGCPVDKYDFW